MHGSLPIHLETDIESDKIWLVRLASELEVVDTENNSVRRVHKEIDITLSFHSWNK